MPRPFFTPGKDPVPIVQEAGWAPGPVWTGMENLAPPPPGIRSPDRPRRSQSLYRLSYSAHIIRVHYKNTDEIYTNSQIAQGKTFDGTVIVGSLRKCKYWFNAQLWNMLLQHVSASICSHHQGYTQGSCIVTTIQLSNVKKNVHLKVNYSMFVWNRRWYRVFLFPLIKRRPNALSVLRRLPRVQEVLHSMTGARQTIAVIITFRKCNKNSLERRAGAYRPGRKRTFCIS